MPLKTSTLTVLLVGLLWLGPGLATPASAKGLLGFGKKKESVVPAPRASGETVFLTKYGPMTAAQYRERLKIEEEKVREAVRRASERREAEIEASRKSAGQAAQTMAEERERAELIAAKEAGAEKKRAEKSAKNLAAQKEAEADRLRAEQAETEKEEERLRAFELKAQKTAEERNAAESGAIASTSRTSAANLSPEERMKEMERIARELAELRMKGQGSAEMATAPSPGPTKPDQDPAPSKTGGTGSRIDRLNRSIFEIVRQRKAAAPALKRVVEGDLFLTTKRRTPFYYFNPLQLVVPDLFLGEGTQVALLKQGKIWSDVRLEDGKEGVIANDFLVEAPVVEIEIPDDNSFATTYDFQYTPISENYVPPALPGGIGLEDRMPSPMLLPPLRSASP